jgi:hypothetical protein
MIMADEGFPYVLKQLPCLYPQILDLLPAQTAMP